MNYCSIFNEKLTDSIFVSFCFSLTFFDADPTHVTNDEIDRVKKLIRYLLMRKTSLSDITLPPDDTICTICYSKSISAKFVPCNHQSCSSCIIQHLMNNKLCFYCKTLILKVQNFDQSIIYEYSPSAPADEQL